MEIKEQLAKDKKYKSHREWVKKEVSKVLDARGLGNRARAAVDLWVRTGRPVTLTNGRRVSPRLANKILLDEVKEIRDTRANQFGASPSGWRWGIELMPQMWQHIQLFHPDIFEGTPHEQRTKFRKLVKAFWEYRIMEKI